MADYGKKVQSDNKHLSSLTTARFIHLDGSVTTPIDLTGIARILRVVVVAKGVAFTLRDGSRVMGNFATTTPEGTYHFGEYCENAPRIDGISGTGSVNISFAP